MLITAEYPWGCGGARRFGLQCGVPDTCPSVLRLVGAEGIYTGVRILACIYLARINCKVRTKSLVHGCVWQHLSIFSTML